MFSGPSRSDSPHPTRSRLATGLACLVLLLVSCSASNEDVSTWGGHGGVSAHGEPGEPCDAGATRSCSITLGEVDGVLSCFHGSQTCNSGSWGPCGDGVIEEQASPLRAGRYRAQALSAPSVCTDNPCDPTCRQYSEEPAEPIVAFDQQGSVTWQSGLPSDLPTALLAKGLDEPCQTSADCQFNTRCRAPDRGTCAHSQCVEGQALDASCNDCSTLVCKDHPECCKAPDAGVTCTHNLCKQGPPLSAACHPCVAKICAANPSCCSATGAWNAACVAAVATECGMACGCGPSEVAYDGRCYFNVTASKTWTDAITSCRGRGTGWDLAAVGDSNENEFLEPYSRNDHVWIGMTDSSPYATSKKWAWSSKSPAGYWTSSGTSTLPYANFKWPWSGKPDDDPGEHCVRMSEGERGRWETDECYHVQPALCEGPRGYLDPSSGPEAWDESCVDRVATICGATCDADAPSLSGGQCVPWFPGETDSTCSGIDLAVGVPCAGSVPVCNHGTSEAPAGIRLVHFAAGSGQFKTSPPNLSDPSKMECFTTEAIPAGKCIDVTGCAGLTNGRELMINPGATVAECDTRDNWSIYNDSACGAPSCGGGVSVSGSVVMPVDIVFIIDNSASMESEIAAVEDRINEDFAKIIESSAIDYRVIMISRFGDYAKAIGEDDHPICVSSPLGGNACTSPSTEKLANNPPRFYHYSASVGSTDAWCLLLASFDKPDEFGSPSRSGWTVKAPNGWSAWLRPDAFKTFVFIGDDDIECSAWGYSFSDARSATGGKTAAAAFDKALLARSSVQFGTAADRKYIWHSIIGVSENTPATAPWPSSAPVSTSVCGTAPGPGTGHQGLSMLTGGLRYPVCRTQDYSPMFTEIAKEIVRSAQSACDLELPSSDVFDVDGAHVGYMKPDGTRVTLSEVSGAAACNGSGWYYDDRSAPQVLHLCPTPCAAMRGITGAHAWLDLECAKPSVSSPLIRTETYEAICADDRSPIWRFLSYDTSVPGDGSVSFRARTATSADQLSVATYESVAVATLSPDTQVCVPGSASGCPVDLGQKLGVAAKRRFLELEIHLTPSSSNEAPELSDWQLTYSCPFDE